MKNKHLFLWLPLGLGLALGIALLLDTPALAAPTSGTISGTVSSPFGYPLPGGTVVKLFQPGSESVYGQANANTANGAFSLGPVPNGLYVLKAVPPSGSGLTQSVPKWVSVIGAPVNVGEIALTTPQITGTVTVPDGSTLVTATVKVLIAGNLVIQNVPAPGGNFQIGGLLAGTYRLRAEPATDDPYWNSAPQTVTVPSSLSAPRARAPNQVVTLALTWANLWGYTKDSFGSPVANAQVRAINQTAPFRHQTDQSSPSGFWAVGGLSNGTYTLIAEPPLGAGGLMPPAPMTVTVPYASNPITLTFGFGPKVVTGTVKTNTNVPVNQAQVLARRVDKFGQADALTAADGSYQLQLSPGLWALTVQSITGTNPADWVYPLPPQLIRFQNNLNPETETQNFTVLTADAQVIGTVKMPDGSAPPFTVTVALHNGEGVGRRANVDANGAFSIRVPNDTYNVAVIPHDPQYLGPPVNPIVVPPNTTYDLGTLTLLAKDAAITGTVKDENGTGVEGIPVVAWRSGQPKAVQTQTGAGGIYVLAVSAGTWHVQPAPGPTNPYLYTGTGQDVTVSSGQTVSNVNFDVMIANAMIHGQLVNSSSQPINDAEGWAQAVQSGNPAVHKGAPIQAGKFDIYVPGGTYNVTAHLPAGSPYMSGAAKNVTVAAGGEVTITLQVLTENAAIAGALWNPRAQAVVSGVHGVVAAWADNNWAATHINAGNGTFRMDVAANLWHLGYRIDPNSGYVKLVEGKNVPVQAGQTAAVSLPIVPKDGTISGTVLGPDRNPLRGATVFADGLGPTIQNVWLKTYSRADGTFNLAVPNGLYRLGATVPMTTSIRPAQQLVNVPPNGTSSGHVLQFKTPDATVSGTLTVSTAGQNGTAIVWGWSRDGGTVHGRFPIANSTGVYSLNVISNTTWHLGAAFETATQYWFGRATVTLGTGNATQNITLNGPYPKAAPVVVTFDASQAQRITLADNTTIYIPAGAMPVSGTVTLRVVPIATLPHQHHANVYKYGYAFLATDSAGQPIEQNFNQDVVIGFSYTEAELAAQGISENALRPAYFSTTTNQWTFPDSYVVNTTANTVTMQIDHFTDFALVAGATVQIYMPIISR